MIWPAIYIKDRLAGIKIRVLLTFNNVPEDHLSGGIICHQQVAFCKACNRNAEAGYY